MAAKMLMDQIGRESALELLNAVRIHTSPPGSTGSDAFDHYIRAVLPQGTHASGFSRGDVIEVQGGPSSGKTHLLYFYAIQTILPPSITLAFPASGLAGSLDNPAYDLEVLLGGRGRTVIVCDCDGRWNMLRLHHMLVNILVAHTRTTLSAYRDIALAQPSLESLAASLLSKIHIFRPSSTLSLAATLWTLPTYHSTRLPNAEIGMLIVDSISAYHWQDRWRYEESEVERKRAPPKPTQTLDGRHLVPIPRGDLNPLKHVLVAIQELRQTLGLITVLSNWGLVPLVSSTRQYAATGAPITQTTQFTQAPSSSSPFFRQHLPAPYPSSFPVSDASEPARVEVIPLAHHITLVPQRSFPVDASSTNTTPTTTEHIRALVRTPATEVDGAGIKSTGLAEGEFFFSISAGGVNMK